MLNNKLRIVSRRSNLAMRQSQLVQQMLLQAHPYLEIEIIGISTGGDENLDTPLMKIGGKGLFVTELEQYLLADKADIAVHSMKDMPATMPEDLHIGAILKRADPRDVFVSQKFNSIQELPPGSIVGTSSLRRQAQVLALNEHVVVEPLRGNVETRIQKLLDGKYSAIILAAAGLERLGLKQWLQYPLDPKHMLPAVGQGAIGVQCKHANQELQQLLAHISDADTTICVNAERAMNALLNGGCQAPIAGFATLTGDQLTLHGLVADPQGTFMLTDTQHGSGTPEELGISVAKKLIAQGALEIIAKAKQ